VDGFRLKPYRPRIFTNARMRCHPFGYSRPHSWMVSASSQPIHELSRIHECAVTHSGIRGRIHGWFSPQANPSTNFLEYTNALSPIRLFAAPFVDGFRLKPTHPRIFTNARIRWHQFGYSRPNSWMVFNQGLKNSLEWKTRDGKGWPDPANWQLLLIPFSSVNWIWCYNWYIKGRNSAIIAHRS